MQWAVYVRAVRGAMALTQQELAARLNLRANGTIVAWEKGRTFPGGTARQSLRLFGEQFGIRCPPDPPSISRPFPTAIVPETAAS